MNKQKGVVLLVALVMLLIVTLLGAAVMRGASLDLKMSNNSQERQQAFNAAEAALSQAESKLLTLNITLQDITFGSSTPCTAGTGHCFNSSCTGGFCFFGSYNGLSQGSCSVAPGTGIPHADPWSDATLDVWNVANKHQNAVADPNWINAGGNALSARYIVEFRCFIDGDSGNVSSQSGDALFRITARGYSAAGNSEVMLQSTFRMKAP